MSSGYEIIPGGLASRKFITINRTRSDEHLASQPAPGVVLHARNIALRISSKVAVSFGRALPGGRPNPHNADEKDDGIISTPVTHEMVEEIRLWDEIFSPRRETEKGFV